VKASEKETASNREGDGMSENPLASGSDHKANFECNDRADDIAREGDDRPLTLACLQAHPVWQYMLKRFEADQIAAEGPSLEALETLQALGTIEYANWVKFNEKRRRVAWSQAAKRPRGEGWQPYTKPIRRAPAAKTEIVGPHSFETERPATTDDQAPKPSVENPTLGELADGQGENKNKSIETIKQRFGVDLTNSESRKLKGITVGHRLPNGLIAGGFLYGTRYSIKPGSGDVAQSVDVEVAYYKKETDTVPDKRDTNSFYEAFKVDNNGKMVKPDSHFEYHEFNPNQYAKMVITVKLFTGSADVGPIENGYKRLPGRPN